MFVRVVTKTSKGSGIAAAGAAQYDQESISV
jgi:hypothetical protein